MLGALGTEVGLLVGTEVGNLESGPTLDVF